MSFRKEPGPSAGKSTDESVAGSSAGTTITNVVMTEQGLLRGEVDAISQVVTFRGIPYAAPPVGELRWRAPTLPQPWSGTRDAFKFSPASVQPPRDWFFEPTIEHEPQSEDCLYLNVATPAKSTSDRLPVMVWIHGGGFQTGTASSPLYEGTKLAQKGVVVVTINYRLNTLGFLVHPWLTAESPYNSSGNYGLLDQIAALTWVQKNIGAFGGDPNCVTIFGFSAGSVSTNVLHASPLASGLFQRAIGQSASQMYPATGLWRQRTFEQAEAYGRRFTEELGITSLVELRKLPAEQLANVSTFFWLIEGDRYFLPEEVHTIFKTGNQNKVPLIVGATEDEATSFGDAVSWIEPDGPEEQAARNRMYGNETHPYERGNTDVLFWQMKEWADRNKQSSPHPTYRYHFAHVPPAPPLPDGRSPGAYHGAEVHYIFGNLDKLDWAWTDDDYQMADLMSGYWVNFARSGNPNGPGLPEWPEDRDNQVFNLSSKPSVIPEPRAEALAFLDEYFKRRY